MAGKRKLLQNHQQMKPLLRKKSTEKSPNKVISQKKKDETENIENMDISVNLKRRRDSGDLVTEGEGKTSKRKLQCHNQRSIHNPSHNRRKKTKLKSNTQPNLFHPHNHQQIHPVNLSTPPPLPNITFSFPSQNSKNAPPVPTRRPENQLHHQH